jgi:hypothetical protein
MLTTGRSAFVISHSLLVIGYFDLEAVERDGGCSGNRIDMTNDE